MGPRASDVEQPALPISLMRDGDRLLSDFRAASERRAAAERDLADKFPRGDTAAEAALRARIAASVSDQQQKLDEFDAESRRLADNAAAEWDLQIHSAESEHRAALREIEGVFADDLGQLEQRYEDSTWVTSSVLDDTAEDSPRRQFEKFKTLLLKAREEQIAVFGDLDQSFRSLAEKYSYQVSPPVEPQFDLGDREQSLEKFRGVVEGANRRRQEVEGQWLPRLFIGLRSAGLFLLLWGAVFAPVFLLAPTDLVGGPRERMSGGWAALSAGVAAAAALFLELVIYTIASLSHNERMRQLQQAVADAEWIHQKWLGFAKEELQTRTREFESRQRGIVAQREQAMSRYEQALSDRRREIDQRRENDLRAERARFQARRDELAANRSRELEALAAQRDSQRQHLLSVSEQEHRELERELETQVSQRQRQAAEQWQTLRAEWFAAVSGFSSSADAARAEAERQFPAWERLARGEWTPPAQIPAGIKVGTIPLDLADVPEALSADARLAPPKSRFEIPVLLDFPNEASLLLKCKGIEARAAAVQVQQTAILRLLTLLPPGTLRLTIIDPVGLGESYAGFMHLADYDEKLVTGRIWTETSHIEARLADLTEHMENVLQKYLRNEFASIEEYNRHAGEVAEPYHFLILSDFPSKFSEVAARRLTSIVASGPRCGVYTLMSCDVAQQLPNNFQLADVEEHMRTLVWRKGAFHAPGELAAWPIAIDAPPRPEVFTGIVRMVGAASKDARRVEVSFARIAPRGEEWWSRDSRQGIDVPLGRAGATKLQHVRLGKGTSQHMLVAGKTGSGKSTFLHGLIVNTALYYGPEEVRFYLIDFKKGVEFKDYASLHLPHADVIAIESDREFGVSALQRLDEVLQQRGELFRRQGVQDIAGFREARPDMPLPRLMLVVDEFQEFFVEDDRLGQTASLLLDRLVRQGRAFGIHVVLGSQTLGGAYSLARSTLGQVAVRVALQCSEADAHLILSEENTAARLLSRPGEAIYNDANGLVQGNHPFQIAWLPDEERAGYLRRMAELADSRGIDVPAPVVFEGNIPSDPARNPELVELLRGSANGDALRRRPPRIWLGEAVEIKAPTLLEFPQHAGSHLLIVGQDSEAAYGIMATGMLALAAQLDRAGERSAADVTPSLYLFDGLPADSPEAEWWRGIATKLGPSVKVIRPRDSAAALTELTAEQQRRDTDRDTVHPPLFVLIYNLGKFRDLRKGEEDFGFSGFGSSAEKPADPGRQFADLLAKGPESGMHAIVWCDTAGNVEKWFGRNTLKEFASRIAFQMNAADSSNLIDSPAASRLGVHRALLHNEESGASEKFRPYGPPSPAWLDSRERPAPDAPPASPVDADPPIAEATDLDAFTIS